MKPSLKRLRKEHGLTLVQLAQAAGCGVSTLNNYELGRFTISQELLRKVANILGVSEEVAPYRARRSLASLPIEAIETNLAHYIQAAPELDGDERIDVLEEIIAHAHELLERERRPNIKGRGGIPVSSKIASDAARGARIAAEKAERELAHETRAPSPSGQADNPSGSRSSPGPGAAGHRKSPRSAPAPAPKSPSDEGDHHKQ